MVRLPLRPPKIHAVNAGGAQGAQRACSIQHPAPSLRLPLHTSSASRPCTPRRWDKQRLAEESANPVLLVSEADRPGTAPTKHLKPDNVRTRPLPLYRCGAGTGPHA